MTTVLVAVPAVVIAIAWLADAGARRAAWRSIALARRGAHRPDACPRCRAASVTPDERRGRSRPGNAPAA